MQPSFSLRPFLSCPILVLSGEAESGSGTVRSMVADATRQGIAGLGRVNDPWGSGGSCRLGPFHFRCHSFALSCLRKSAFVSRHFLSFVAQHQAACAANFRCGGPPAW